MEAALELNSVYMCKDMTSTLCFHVITIGLGCGYSRPLRCHWPLLSGRICAAFWEGNVSVRALLCVGVKVSWLSLPFLLEVSP